MRRRRPNYYQQGTEFKLTPQEEAYRTNMAAAEQNRALRARQMAESEAEDAARLEAANAEKSKQSLAAAMGVPLRESYFNESLGVQSSRPVKGREKMTMADLQSQFETLPGYEQEAILRKNKSMPDATKRLEGFQNEREKSIQSQVGQFSQDLASGKIFHQKGENGKHELMVMQEDPNATEEDRMLGKVKKIPVPISMGQRALFVEAMRRKALPEGMEALQLNGFNNEKTPLAGPVPNMPSTSPVGMSGQTEEMAAIANRLASKGNGITPRPQLTAQGVGANPMEHSDFGERPQPASMELTPWQITKKKFTPTYTTEQAGADLANVANIGVETAFNSGRDVLNVLGRGVQGVNNYFTRPEGAPDPYTPIPEWHRIQQAFSNY